MLSAGITVMRLWTWQDKAFDLSDHTQKVRSLDFSVYTTHPLLDANSGDAILEFRGRHTDFDGFLEAGRLQRSRKEANGVPGTPYPPEAHRR